jgi:menaquinone-dependent protoporphyrinogen oxidase
MKPILVAYATREGHTRRIAHHVAELIRMHGREVQLLDVAAAEPPLEMGAYAAALVAGSVHAGAHEREMVRFVKAHRAELERLPAAFISVSLTEAGAEDPAKSAAQRREASRAVDQMIQKFLRETGWHPLHIKPVAGALLYTKYGRLLRFVIKRIVASQGGSTDTTRDHDYTDWPSLARFVEEFMCTLPQRPISGGGAAESPVKVVAAS